MDACFRISSAFLKTPLRSDAIRHKRALTSRLETVQCALAVLIWRVAARRPPCESGRSSPRTDGSICEWAGRSEDREAEFSDHLNELGLGAQGAESRFYTHIIEKRRAFVVRRFQRAQRRSPVVDAGICDSKVVGGHRSATSERLQGVECL